MRRTRDQAVACQGAAALFLGGTYRRALVAFEDLAAAYTRVGGPEDERARACRKQAAICHAELGETEAAIAAFQNLLGQGVRAGHSTRDAEALEVRRQPPHRGRRSPAAAA